MHFVNNKQNIFLRPNLFGGDFVIEELLEKLLSLGYRNFLIPKYNGINDLRKIEFSLSQTLIAECNFILLIENPGALFSLYDTISNTKLNVTGLAFGSQDYCLATGMVHQYDFLRYPRFIVAGIAKAFGIISIDIACMELDKEDIFILELIEAEKMGFDAKFVIHPSQLKLLTKSRKYSELEIQEAMAVIREYNELGQPSVFVYNGKAVEPPHIKNFQNIIELNKYYGSK
ncbi:MAG: hypothetical protein IPF68_08595 [Bacteroidales bacterium]|nr:hypothetical protein [Bacteroidales bacterium]